jgi:hypothetical protein
MCERCCVVVLCVVVLDGETKSFTNFHCVMDLL